MACAWVLGSMGWMTSGGLQTACVLVELGDELILLDAGTGVANLSLCEPVLERHERMTILLSHYHLDHVAGLMYLKRFAASMRVDVYGPGQPVYPKSTQAYMADVLQRAVYSSGPNGFAREVHCHDYGGADFAVGDVDVRVRPQRHSAPSFELRLGDALTYATDTSFDALAWAAYPSTKVLLHECWQGGDGDPRHTSVEALVAGVPTATFDRVVLVHQNPAWDACGHDHIARLAATRGFELAYDGMRLEL